MITPELVSYITSQRALGKSDADIKQMLFAGGGWTSADLDEAFMPVPTPRPGFVSTEPIPRVPQGLHSMMLPIFFFIAAMIVLGAAGFFYMNREMFAQKPSVQESTAVASNLKTFDSSESTKGFDDITFTYPDTWKVALVSPNYVHLLPSEVELGTDPRATLESGQEVVISVYMTDVPATKEIIASSYRGTDIQDAVIADKNLVKFTLNQSINNGTLQRVAYVLTTPYRNKKSVMFALTTPNSESAVKDVKVLEGIIESFKIIPGPDVSAEFEFIEQNAVIDYKYTSNKLSDPWARTFAEVNALPSNQINDSTIRSIGLKNLNELLEKQKSFVVLFEKEIQVLREKSLPLLDTQQMTVDMVMSGWDAVLSNVKNKRITYIEGMIVSLNNTVGLRQKLDAVSVKDFTELKKIMDLDSVSHQQIQAGLNTMMRSIGLQGEESVPDLTSSLKGMDAAIKANLSNIRAQAEIAYDTDGTTYDTVCGKNGKVQDSTIATLIKSAKAYSGKGECLSSNTPEQAYAVYAELMSQPSKYWCVDSRGASIQIDTPPTGPFCERK